MVITVTIKAAQAWVRALSGNATTTTTVESIEGGGQHKQCIKRSCLKSTYKKPQFSITQNKRTACAIFTYNAIGTTAKESWRSGTYCFVRQKTKDLFCS